MFKESLTFLKEQLTNQILEKKKDHTQVTFVENNEPKQVVLKNEAITILLTNFEEERTFKSGAALPPSQGSYPLSIDVYERSRGYMPESIANGVCGKPPR